MIRHYSQVSFAVVTLLLFSCRLPAADYLFLAGSTHAHTAYTWSHGDQFEKNGCAGILTYRPDAATPDISRWFAGAREAKDGCPSIYVINGSQIPAPHVTVRPDWQKYQGVPAEHFSFAKSNGFDFYVTADHSQESVFQPTSADTPAWAATKKQAAAATTANFVALAGFEFSENDGPGGMGHINVINAEGMINALDCGVDLPAFYKWLQNARPNGDGAVVATFNHPGAKQYADWAHRDAGVTDIITMLEVINSNNKIHYDAFVKALDKGWKVSPVCGNDNHGLRKIATDTSRTFVLATDHSKAAITEAMKNRRTYVSLARALQARYSVNGMIMGSTLKGARSQYRFDIAVTDPRSDSTKNRITKIDIVKDGGAIVSEYKPEAAAHTVHWTPAIDDANAKYFFVRVWNEGGGDAPGANPANPVAWLAPVWTGR